MAARTHTAGNASSWIHQNSLCSHHDGDFRGFKSQNAIGTAPTDFRDSPSRPRLEPEPHGRIFLFRPRQWCWEVLQLAGSELASMNESPAHPKKKSQHQHGRRTCGTTLGSRAFCDDGGGDRSLQQLGESFMIFNPKTMEEVVDYYSTKKLAVLEREGSGSGLRESTRFQFQEKNSGHRQGRRSILLNENGLADGSSNTVCLSVRANDEVLLYGRGVLGRYGDVGRSCSRTRCVSDLGTADKPRPKFKKQHAEQQA